MSATGFRRLVIACAVLGVLPAAALRAQETGTAAGVTPTAAELDELEARYKAVLAQLAEIERQQQAVEQLIARAEAVESVRAGAAAPSPAAPAATSGAQPRAAAAAPAQATQTAQAPRASQSGQTAQTAQTAQAAQPRASTPAAAASAAARPAATQQPAQQQAAAAQQPAAQPTRATTAAAQPAAGQQAPAQQTAAARPATPPAQTAAAARPPAAQTQAPAAQAQAAAVPARSQQAAAQEVPVVAAERREEQEQASVPELPRVSSEVGGVLTPKGRVVVEPSMSYSYSSVSRVAIEGFTILPALLIGIIDVVEADRDTYISSISARLGLTHRLELELKSSYVYRNDATRSREYLKDSISDTVFNARGSGPGDYELGLRWQFKRRSPTGPYLVGNLRYKAANGTDPFAIATQSQLSGEPQFSQQLPTGSGFRSVSPSLTFIYPTDPVVFFGSIGYMWTEGEDKGKWLDAEGKTVGFGRVDPGDALRASFGLGLGLNDRSSLSLSYQLDKFTKTYIETAAVQDIVGSDVTVGKLLVGYSLRLNNGAPLNFAVGIGTTGDAADTDLTFRMPFSFNNK